MKGSITIAYLQKYLRSKDHNVGHEIDYFLKLIEETGELSKALAYELVHAEGERFKGTVEEELWDVMYYTVCLANLYEVDLEKWIRIKENYNNARYNPDLVYDPEGPVTVAWLQDYLYKKDRWPGYATYHDFFCKMIEEIGELAEMIYKGAPHAEGDSFKHTVEEELWDVLYYLLLTADMCGVDMEHWIPIKEAYNNARYNPGVVFGE